MLIKVLRCLFFKSKIHLLIKRFFNDHAVEKISLLLKNNFSEKEVF